jgi:hypothetical protein
MEAWNPVFILPLRRPFLEAPFDYFDPFQSVEPLHPSLPRLLGQDSWLLGLLYRDSPASSSPQATVNSLLPIAGNE